MSGEAVSLLPEDLKKYREKIEAFRRKQINEPSQADGRRLWTDLEDFLRDKYEGRDKRLAFRKTSVMGDAFARVSKRLLKQGRHPLIFADTQHEANFLISTLRANGLNAQSWSEISSKKISGHHELDKNSVIVAVKTTEGQGVNMQRHADAIICRPTPGDHLEQMKGRVDRPGQKAKQLILVVLMAEHTIEEAKFANIRLAGNFFREYIAPVASKYKERIDLEATLAAGGTKKLTKGTVTKAWRQTLEEAGQSGAFAVEDSAIGSDQEDDDEDVGKPKAKKRSTAKKTKTDIVDDEDVEEAPNRKPLNKVLRNKGDRRSVAQAKKLAKEGKASLVLRQWLYSTEKKQARTKGLAKDSIERFSTRKPALVMTPETVREGVIHLTKNDPKLASLIARVGAGALINGKF
jgi:hypothetical protein